MPDAPSPSVTPLTEGVLAALDRPANPILSLSTANAVLTGLLTAGLWPAVDLPRRWLNALRWDRTQVDHVGDWAATNLGEAGAETIRTAATSAVSRWLARGAIALAMCAAVVAVTGVARGLEVWLFWFSDPRADPLVRAYLTLLGSSYLATWLAVNLELRQMADLGRILGEFTNGKGGIVRRMKRWEWGVRPVPLTLGLVLTFFGLPWALPMLLATTAQRRTLNVHARRARQEIAGRLRETTEQKRPAVTLPAPVGRGTPCVNARCGERLPHDARHCPRCGSVQSSALQRALD